MCNLFEFFTSHAVFCGEHEVGSLHRSFEWAQSLEVLQELQVSRSKDMILDMQSANSPQNSERIELVIEYIDNHLTLKKCRQLAIWLKLCLQFGINCGEKPGDRPEWH